MAMRDILDRQAGTIEYVLHTHGIRAQVDGGKLSPRLAHFHLLLPAGLNPSRLGHFIPELADALGVVTCRLSANETGVYLEVPRPDPVPVRLLPLVQRVADVVPPVTATLGLDTEGTPLLLRLNSPEVDPVIISGDAGSGKSSLLRGITLSLALHNSPENVRLLLLDCSGEGRAFRGLENLPHLPCPVANGPVESLASLRWALRALARRTSLAESSELTFDDEDEDEIFFEDEAVFEYTPLQASEPSLVIIIDGADRLCRPGARSDTEATDALRRLITSGSLHDIHVVLAAERPDMIGINAGWGARVVGKVASSEAARAATGIKGSGAHGLLGSGDFLVSLNSELIRFQSAAVTSGEVERAVDLIRSCASNYPQPNIEEPPVRSRRDRGRERANRQSSSQPLPLRRGQTGD